MKTTERGDVMSGKRKFFDHRNVKTMSVRFRTLESGAPRVRAPIAVRTKVRHKI